MTATQGWALAALAVCAGLGGGAQFMEHVIGLDPCPLCLMQRIWVLLAGLVVCLALADNLHRGIYPLTVIACSLIGGGFSIRQLYLQSLPPDAVPLCGPDLDYMIDVFPFSETLRAMILGTGNCAEVDWSLLGISIAGWALAGFAFLVVLALYWWRASRLPG
jgi:disulfide bond formation protein DsbB